MVPNLSAASNVNIQNWPIKCLPSKYKLSNKRHYDDDKGLKNKIKFKRSTCMAYEVYILFRNVSSGDTAVRFKLRIPRESLANLCVDLIYCKEY